jgi:aryl-alcohol dehydrogenase-like predicted oxidoreductase
MLVHAETSARETAILDTLLAVAAEQGATPTHIAIAWLRDKAALSNTGLIPILGSRTREQFDATLGALQVTLSDEQVARLDNASAIALGVPHEQVEQSFERLNGGQQLEVPRVPVA